jgi:predicted metal-dependent phosphoesterase TrpH
VNDVGGVMIMAHPYRRRLYMDDSVPAAVERYYQRPFFKLVDSIEVLNGKATARQNEFSQELCRRLNLKGIGGSDAHVAADIPSSATLFERKIGSVAELIAEIKAGRFQPIDLRQPASLP